MKITLKCGCKFEYGKKRPTPEGCPKKHGVDTECKHCVQFKYNCDGE